MVFADTGGCFEDYRRYLSNSPLTLTFVEIAIMCCAKCVTQNDKALTLPIFPKRASRGMQEPTSHPIARSIGACFKHARAKPSIWRES